MTLDHALFSNPALFSKPPSVFLLAISALLSRAIPRRPAHHITAHPRSSEFTLQTSNAEGTRFQMDLGTLLSSGSSSRSWSVPECRELCCGYSACNGYSWSNASANYGTCLLFREAVIEQVPYSPFGNIFGCTCVSISQ